MLKVLDVKKSMEQQILSIPGVWGIATQGDTIVIFVEFLTDSLREILPTEVDGFPVQIIESPRPNPLSCVRCGIKTRPAVGGVSCGGPSYGCGTLGIILNNYLVSCNHVFAHSSFVDNPLVNVGDPVYQPSISDGGESEIIGTIYDWVPFPMDGTPSITADVAIAKAIDTTLIQNNYVLEVGETTIANDSDIIVGTQIQKSGRTTGLTTGQIMSTSLSWTGTYRTGFPQVIISDCVWASIPCDSCDSGSPGVTMDGKLFGVLFAGSLESVTGVFTKMSHILEYYPFLVGNPGNPSIVPLSIGLIATAYLLTEHSHK